MTLKRWTGASFTDLATLKRWTGAAWVDVASLKKWNGSAWVTIPLPGGGGGALSATASPGSAHGYEARIGSAPAVLTVTTNSVTVTASFGTAPYTYAWTHESGDSAVQVNSPVSATTVFSGNIGKNQYKLATKRCTVTDSLGATAFVIVPADLEYEWEPNDL